MKTEVEKGRGKGAFGEEQTWENRGIGKLRSWSHVNRLLVSMLVWSYSIPDHQNLFSSIYERIFS